MTISEVRGRGAQKGVVQEFRGQQVQVDYLPKIKIEIVINTTPVDDVIDAIVENAASGQNRRRQDLRAGCRGRRPRAHPVNGDRLPSNGLPLLTPWAGGRPTAAPPPRGPVGAGIARESGPRFTRPDWVRGLP